MIINETTNTYEDIKHMYKKAKRTPLLIGCRIFFVIAGLFMFVEAMNLITNNMQYFVYVSAGGELGVSGCMLIMLIALMFILGIIFIIFNFYFLKFSIYRTYKKTYSKWSARHLEFTEDAVEISYEEKGIKSNTTISYDMFDSYDVCNDAIYIAVKSNNSKANKYICVHDDSYIEGNADELIELLNKVIESV